MSVAGRLIVSARRRAGLSQAELARRAGVPRSVANVYERGAREPGADALDRLVRATGRELRTVAGAPLDVQRADRILRQVLDLAEQLPSRRRSPHLPPNPFRT